MPEVSYSQLLNQYHTAISKAQNYQEELAKKKEQWEKREREFNITEKLTRELCEDILAKDGEEMKLGEEYSWSSIPINKLIKKTGDVFRQYNSDRTELEKKLMKTAEERRQQIESLQDQIIRMKTKDSNGDFSIENKSASLKNKEEYDPKKIQSVISTDTDANIDEQSIINDMEEDGQVIQLTPSSIASTTHQKNIRARQKSKKRENARNSPADGSFMLMFQEIEEKMNEFEWGILKIIGETGYSTFEDIASEVFKRKTDVSKNRIRTSCENLKNMGLLHYEIIKIPVKSFAVYYLEALGEKIYEKKYREKPVLSEYERIVKEHDNPVHGYGIKELRLILEEMNCFTTICDENRKNPVQIEKNIIYVPDIFCTFTGKKGQARIYFEYECGNHTQTDFNSKLNRMVKVMRVLNFVTPNIDAAEKICEQVKNWIKNRGAGSLKKTKVRVTTIRQLKGVNVFKDENWRYVFIPEKSCEPTSQL